MLAWPRVRYAPAKMVGHPKAKGISKKQLAEAVQRLLDAGRIKKRAVRVAIAATLPTGGGRKWRGGVTFHRSLPPSFHHLPPGLCSTPLIPPGRWKHRPPGGSRAADVPTAEQED